jgi:hypothetical protein
MPAGLVSDRCLKRFGQLEIRQRRGAERQAGGDEGRDRLVEVSEHAADRGPDRERDPERRAEQAHVLGLLRGVNGVGDVGLRRGDVAAGDAVDDSRNVDQSEPEQRVLEVHRGHEPEQERRAGRAELRDHEHRTPPDTIRERAEDRRGDKLARGVDRQQHRDFELGGVELQRVEREERDDQPEAEHIDQHDEKEQPERLGARGSRCWVRSVGGRHRGG